LLVPLLVILRTPADRVILEVDVFPEEIPASRDPSASSLGHYQCQFEKRIYPICDLEQLQVFVVSHHRPLGGAFLTAKYDMNVVKVRHRRP